MQIALAQPFRIGDTVYIQENWGRIEEISYTYVVVRTWDARRLVIPIMYFVTNTIENWSKTDSFLIKPIYLHVDYRADVQAIRERFHALIEDDEDWDRDGDEPAVLVTDSTEETVTVRLTCGGKDAGAAWRLHCRVQEKLIAWLNEQHHGTYLPRQRVLLTGGNASGDQSHDERDEHDEDVRR